MEVSSIESSPITVTWKSTIVGWSFTFGGLILSYMRGSSGNKSWRVKCVDLGNNLFNLLIYFKLVFGHGSVLCYDIIAFGF